MASDACAPTDAGLVAWSQAVRRWLRRRHFRPPLLDDLAQEMVSIALEEPQHGRKLRWAYLRARTRFQVRRQTEHVRQWAWRPEILVATADRRCAVDYEGPIYRQEFIAASPPHHRGWLREVLLEGWRVSEIADRDGISRAAMSARVMALRRHWERLESTSKETPYA